MEIDESKTQMDYKLILNRQLDRIARLSSEVLDSNGKSLYKLRAGVFVLDSLLIPYHDDTYKKSRKELFIKIRKDKDNSANNQFSQILAHLGVLMKTFERKNLLLENIGEDVITSEDLK